MPAKGKQAQPTKNTDETLDLTKETEADEESLQHLLEQCASTVGVDAGSASSLSSKKEDEMSEISSEEGKLASKPKWARSAAPLT